MYSTADPVCVGHGLDSAAVGLLSAVIIPSAIGLILWVRCFRCLPQITNTIL